MEQFNDPTIDTVGKCANCGVEFHIHKERKANELIKTAMMIVNQLYDLAEVPVEKRQAINDIATNYVNEILITLL